MSDVQKTINILNEIPKDIATKISMKTISEVLNIMSSINEQENHEPTIEDFLEAFYVRIKIEHGIEDIEKGNFYTTEELKKELNI